MNELQFFKNDEFGEVRTALKNDKVMICLSDICRVLDIGNTTDVKNRLKEDGVDTIEVIDSIGRTQQATFINEPNLYRVIFQSKKTNAEKFTDWVTSEVLPAIRKHGVYTLDNMLDDPDALIVALTNFKAEREKRRLAEQQLAIKTQQVNELQPKATYCQEVLKCGNAIPITVIAKDYGMSGKELNKILANNHIQYKCGDTWVLYSDYQDKHYTKTETGTKEDSGYAYTITKWTQEGRLFIYELLKSLGYLPLIEKKYDA